MLLDAYQLTLGVAESLTGGLVGARLASVAGASGFFRGAIVAYDREVKFDLLGVPRGPVVSEEAVIAMAQGARKAGAILLEKGNLRALRRALVS